jgi:hypothetical protein
MNCRIQKRREDRPRAYVFRLGKQMSVPQPWRNLQCGLIIFDEGRLHDHIMITGNGMPPAFFSILHPYMSMEPGTTAPRKGMQLRSRSSGSLTPRFLIHFLTVRSAQRPPTNVPVCGWLNWGRCTRICITCNVAETRGEVEQSGLDRRREVKARIDYVSNWCQEGVLGPHQRRTCRYLDYCQTAAHIYEALYSRSSTGDFQRVKQNKGKDRQGWDTGRVLLLGTGSSFAIVELPSAQSSAQPVPHSVFDVLSLVERKRPEPSPVRPVPFAAKR